MIQSGPTISMRSLYCAAFLLVRGHNLVTFEMVDPKNGNFIFERDTSIESDVAEYHDSGSCTQVPIKDYLQYFRELRDLVMTKKRAASKNIRRLT